MTSREIMADTSSVRISDPRFSLAGERDECLARLVGRLNDGPGDADEPEPNGQLFRPDKVEGHGLPFLTLRGSSGPR